MWIARIRHGVLQVSTGAGRRYVKPSAWERLYLLWTFRNFRILPHQVLSPRQSRMILALCAQGQFANPENIEEDGVIGTVEFLPPRKPPGRYSSLGAPPARLLSDRLGRPAH